MIIKEEPEDFRVKEIPKVELDENGDQQYFWLRKRNYTTIRAIQTIARALRVGKRRIGFAGNKDKNAITEQVISIWNIPHEQAESLNLKDIELKFIGSGKEKICLGDLNGNEFEIIARGKYTEKNVLKKAKEIEKNGFPNFFGEQRFGVASNSHLIGKAIIKGYFEQAVKELLTKSSENPESKEAADFAKKNWHDWKEILKKMPMHQSIEKSVLNWLVAVPNDYAGALRVLHKGIRRIFVHAYQSWLWNSALEKMMLAKKKIKKELPIPGYETKLGRDEFSKNLKALMKKDDMELEDFKCKRMPELASAGEFRQSFIKPKGLELYTEKNMIKLSFTLDKGTYATTLLRELFGESVGE